MIRFKKIAIFATLLFNYTIQATVQPTLTPLKNPLFIIDVGGVLITQNQIKIYLLI